MGRLVKLCLCERLPKIKTKNLFRLNCLFTSRLLNDIKDIEHRRVQTVKQISGLLSYFGSELWDLSCSAIDVLCVFWRRALKTVWKLPLNTHGNSNLL